MHTLHYSPQTALIISFLQFARYLFFAGGAYLIVGIFARERLRRYRVQKPDFKAPDVRRELGYSVMTAGIFGAVLAIAISPAMRPYTAIYEDPAQHGRLWFLISFPLLVLIHDTYFYWSHRLMHHPKIFRQVHRVHHLSTNPSPLAAMSFHPTEAVMEVAWVLPVMFLMPIQRQVFLAFSVFMIVMNVIGHLGIEIYPKGWKAHRVMRWLNTSTHHNGHHRHFLGNYGLYFLFWDRWMGTEISSQNESRGSGLVMGVSRWDPSSPACSEEDLASPPTLIPPARARPVS